MVNDKDFYRIVRYFSVLTFEHYQTQLLLADKFNFTPPKPMTLEDIMKNVCKDFGLPFEAVLENSDLNQH